LKKGMGVIVLLVTLCLLFVGCGNKSTPSGNSDKPAVENKFISIATGGVTGVYYPLGGAFSTLINNKMENVKSSVETTGGSVANINLLQKKEAELAFSASSVVFDAVKGEGTFAGKKVDNIRAILGLYPEAVQIVTLADLGITSVKDLKNKKVAVGDMGSGTEVMAREILSLYGLSYNDINEDFLGFGEASTGLKDRTMNAAFIWAGVPTAGIMDLAAQNKIALIEIDKDHIDKLTQKLPYCTVMKIPANTYKGLDKDATTVAIPAVLVGSDDLSADFVYNFLKTVFANLDLLQQAHARGKDISKNTALDGLAGIPLHPGAEKFYKEIGLIK